MKLSALRRVASRATAVAALPLLAGCLSITDPLGPIFWTGTVVADAGTGFFIAGTTEMVANVNDTSVGVFLEADPETEIEVSWHVRYGPCSGSGERIAPPSTFPAITLVAGDLGAGIADIRRRLPGGVYAAEIFDGPDATGTRIACGELSES